MTLPITGQASTALGGLSAADIGLTMQYANLNQPQSIGAPTSVRPFTEFQSKLRTIVGALQGSVGSVTGSAGGSTTGSGSGGSSGSSFAVTSYSQCIQAAGGDVSKMQQCASLLNGSSP